MINWITSTRRNLRNALVALSLVLLLASCHWAPSSNDTSISVRISGDLSLSMYSGSSASRLRSIGTPDGSVVAQQEDDFDLESDLPDEVSLLFLYALDERAVLDGSLIEGELDEEQIFSDAQLEEFFFSFLLGEQARLSGRLPGGVGALVWSANDYFAEGDTATFTLSGLSGGGTRYVLFAFYEISTGSFDDFGSEDRYVMGVTTATIESGATTSARLQMNLDERAFDQWFIDEYGFIPGIFAEDDEFESDEFGGTELLGQAGPAGGTIFYYDATGEFEWVYLEVASIDVEFDVGDGRHVWGPAEPAVRYAEIGTALGSGRRNTEVVNQDLEEAPNTAAFRALNFEQGGFTDWFLPSLDELQALTGNLSAGQIGGVFEGSGYWSSSVDESTGNAWVVWLDGSNEPLLSAPGNFQPIRAIREVYPPEI